MQRDRDTHTTLEREHRFVGLTFACCCGMCAQGTVDRVPDQPTMTPAVAFVFSGQGAQWVGMGVEAYSSMPAFRATIDRLMASFPGDTAAQLHATFVDGVETPLSEGPALTAYQIAAVNAVKAAGVGAPTHAIGYSIGEIAAAFAASVLTESEAFALSMARTALAASESPAGTMAVTGLTEANYQRAVTALGLRRTYVACFNSPENLTIAGPQDEMVRLRDHLRSSVSPSILWRAVETRGKAFHSPTLRPRKDSLNIALSASLSRALGNGQNLITHATKTACKWISTSSKEGSLPVPAGTDLAAYFSSSLVEPVRFSDAVATLPPSTVVLEVGPSSGLLRLVQQRMDRSDIRTVPLVRRGQPSTERSLGDLPSAVPKPASTMERAYRAVFVFCGEGAHASDTDIDVLRTSPAWNEVAEALRQVMNCDDLGHFLEASRGCPSAPVSILVTTIINILHSALWKSWGVEPDVAVGHSSGDVAAAHACGMYSTIQVMITCLPITAFLVLCPYRISRVRLFFLTICGSLPTGSPCCP